MKRQAVAVALALGSSLTGTIATAQEGVDAVDAVTKAWLIPAAILAFQSELSEFYRFGLFDVRRNGVLKLDKYRIAVTTLSGHYAVHFHDVNSPAMCRGFCPPASRSS
jgi:hypothetical protein